MREIAPANVIGSSLIHGTVSGRHERGKRTDTDLCVVFARKAQSRQIQAQQRRITCYPLAHKPIAQIEEQHRRNSPGVVDREIARIDIDRHPAATGIDPPSAVAKEIVAAAVDIAEREASEDFLSLADRMVKAQRERILSIRRAAGAGPVIDVGGPSAGEVRSRPEGTHFRCDGVDPISGYAVPRKRIADKVAWTRRVRSRGKRIKNSHRLPRRVPRLREITLQFFGCRNRKCAGKSAPVPQTFIICKPERLVVSQWTSGGCSELVQGIVSLRLSSAITEPVVRVQSAVAQKLIHASMHLVAAGLEHKIDYASSSAPKLRVEVGILYFEFLDSIDRGYITRRIVSRRIRGRAVDERFVRHRLAAVHGKISGGISVGTGRNVAELSQGLRARRQADERERVAAG